MAENTVAFTDAPLGAYPVIKEKSMPRAVKISELKDCEGRPLDLSVEASSHAISL